nr:MAG TPA_asm: hypothetical protein [Caudoviricetes sp.]
MRLICAHAGPILNQIYRPIKLAFKKTVQPPFKIKMQFDSIKLFARFVFLDQFFNYIANLLFFS